MIESIVTWGLILGFFYWYANRYRHPDRKAVAAFGIFVGIFFGITFAALFSVVAIVLSLGQEGGKWGKALGPVLAMFVIVPAWQFAKSRIKKAPKTNA